MYRPTTVCLPCVASYLGALPGCRALAVLRSRRVCLTGVMQYTIVTADDFATLDGVDDWRVVLNVIHAGFRLPSFPDATRFAVEVAEAAEAAQHHPDIDIRYPGRVHIALTTHATGGLTTLDVDVARTISELARTAGATSEPLAAQMVEIAIDTLDADRIRPFWAAVLDYREVNGSLHDPRRDGPRMWFQQMETARSERSRFHIDVSVAHDVAEVRIAAALAAGGVLVSESAARSWWILADADGNEACVCTWQDR
jgi:4a-hydroxytetrahydrobiopterin dehydratase